MKKAWKSHVERDCIFQSLISNLAKRWQHCNFLPENFQRRSLQICGGVHFHSSFFLGDNKSPFAAVATAFSLIVTDPLIT